MKEAIVIWSSGRMPHCGPFEVGGEQFRSVIAKWKTAADLSSRDYFPHLIDEKSNHVNLSKVAQQVNDRGKYDLTGWANIPL